MAKRKRQNCKYQSEGPEAALYDVSTNLNEDDVRGFRFLLRDNLNKSEREKPILGIFQHLQQRKLITHDDLPWIVIEALECMGQHKLISDCFGDVMEQRRDSRISAYRQTLYHIGMDLTVDNLRGLAYLFRKHIPESRKEKFKCALDLFLFLEEKSIVQRGKTNELQDKLTVIGQEILANRLQLINGDAPSNDGSNNVTDVSPDTHTIVLKKSVIKSIHIYQRNPPAERHLEVYHETNNGYDPNACVVSLTSKIFKKCEKRRGKMMLHQDITGGIIGSVPKPLSEAFRYALDKGCSITAVKTGEPCPSFPPWPHMYDRGGGLVLPCDYVFYCFNDHITKDVYTKLDETVNKSEVGRSMKLCNKMLSSS